MTLLFTIPRILRGDSRNTTIKESEQAHNEPCMHIVRKTHDASCGHVWYCINSREHHKNVHEQTPPPHRWRDTTTGKLTEPKHLIWSAEHCNEWSLKKEEMNKQMNEQKKEGKKASDACTQTLWLDLFYLSDLIWVFLERRQRIYHITQKIPSFYTTQKYPHRSSLLSLFLSLISLTLFSLLSLLPLLSFSLSLFFYLTKALIPSLFS